MSALAQQTSNYHTQLMFNLHELPTYASSLPVQQQTSCLHPTRLVLSPSPSSCIFWMFFGCRVPGLAVYCSAC